MTMKKLKKIKENLLGNPKEFKSFTIKNGILCKQFSSKKDGMMFMGPYIPDKILRAVVAYVHRRNLHPSTSQTAKEFKAYYYHPMEVRTFKNVYRAAIAESEVFKRDSWDKLRGVFTEFPEKPYILRCDCLGGWVIK
jgi:hypothetical protein